MPRYDAKRIEAKWQAHWDEQQTFRTPEQPPASSTGKLYVLDMFPYPSSNGLHVGHPEGYTATDIVCRYSRMRGKHVLHPMGWDAFGLPAEEHAIKTGTHPRATTEANITNFRRQLKMLGFSYDWNREIATTDVDYYRWTQWIFLQLFDTWYDADCVWTGPDGVRRTGRGRPISELPIPADVSAQGDEGVRRYQDSQRLAYQHEAPVNWCPALGTVLANEEVIDGKSERGGHPVERLPLRQWMLGITAYADRLGSELEDLNWPESIKSLQRNWIGRSEGAEVDFVLAESGAQKAESQTKTPAIRVYTTRPDTLFGVTYMVLSPEHPLVEQITTPAHRAAVEAYRKQASLKSDLDRTDLAKDKSGEFTGAYAINPVNGDKVPVWIADYVLSSYGTGAIMAVPAHDDRDFEFAKKFGLPIRAVVGPSDTWLRDQTDKFVNWMGDVGHVVESGAKQIRNWIGRLPLSPLLKKGLELADQAVGKAPSVDHLVHAVRQIYLHDANQFASAFTDIGVAVNSGKYDGLPTAEFKARITADLEASGQGKKAVNYRLRDWLFSRQRYWGEPFPLWHELDANGQPTGLMRTDAEADLPVVLPEMADFKPTGTPEPLLSKAPEEWLYRTAPDGVRLKRETNSMPQWAGSCWYYLRFCDPKNDAQFIDPEQAKYWLPVDLYIGGAEHAVLHLLYSRFWHKVLFDRGYLEVPEPFGRLVNQGMILGEMEVTLEEAPGEAKYKFFVRSESGKPVFLGANEVKAGLTKDGKPSFLDAVTGDPVTPEDVDAGTVVLRDGKAYAHLFGSELELETRVLVARSFKMSKSRGNVINPDDVVAQYGADALRLYEMFMGPLEATKPWSMAGVEGIFRFLGRVWRLVVDDRADEVQLNESVRDVPPTPEQLRVLHRTIKAVTEDIEKLSFNTAISRMMEFVNEFTSQEVRPQAILEPFLLLLSPFAPHLAEELWQLLGHEQTLAYEPWPSFDPALLEETTVEVPVQVNGKVRGKITVPKTADQAAVQAAAEADPAVAGNLAGKTIVKVIYIAGRTLNFVVK